MKALNIYYKPHQSRVREHEFFLTLKSHFPMSTHCPIDYGINPQYLKQYVDRDRVVAFLESDTNLPVKKRILCIQALGACPKQIKVTPFASNIGFDIVLENEGKVHYFEFHEKQHRSLSVSRPQKIYAPDNTEYLVPRFLQRFIRDIWRTMYFRPFTIIWFDWFAEHKNDYMPEFHNGLIEHHLENRFSFTDFCQLT